MEKPIRIFAKIDPSVVVVRSTTTIVLCTPQRTHSDEYRAQRICTVRARYVLLLFLQDFHLEKCCVRAQSVVKLQLKANARCVYVCVRTTVVFIMYVCTWYDVCI